MPNIFEIILRNAINQHYMAHFNDADWIYHQLQSGGMLEHSPHQRYTLNDITAMVAKGKYTPTKLLHLLVSVSGRICSPKFFSVLSYSLSCRYLQPVNKVYAQNNYALILKYISFLGYDKEDLLLAST